MTKPRPTVEHLGARTIVQVTEASAEALGVHLRLHNIRTAVLGDGPADVVRLELISPGDDIEAALRAWSAS